MMVTVLGIKSHQYLILKPQFLAEEMTLGFTLLDKANMKPVIDNSHPFTQEGIKEGYEKLASRRARGRIVYTISPKR